MEFQVGNVAGMIKRSAILPEGTIIEPLTEEEMALESQIRARSGRGKNEFG